MNMEKLKPHYFPLITSILFFITFQLMALLIRGEDVISYFVVASLLLIEVITATGLTFIYQERRPANLIPYLVHPIFLLLGVCGVLLFNKNTTFQEIIILGACASYFILFSETFSDLAHHIHDGVKFFIIFLLYDTVLEGTYYTGLPTYISYAALFLLTIVLQLHMLWRLQALTKKFIMLITLIAAVVTLASWSLMSYYYLSSFLPLSLMILAVYYFCWGMVHHLIEKNLTLRIFFEYFLVCLIVIMMFFGLTSGF